MCLATFPVNENARVTPEADESVPGASSEELDVLQDLGDEIATLAAHMHAAEYRFLTLIAEFDPGDLDSLGVGMLCRAPSEAPGWHRRDRSQPGADCWTPPVRSTRNR